MSSYHREPARAFRGLTSLFVLVALAATLCGAETCVDMALFGRTRMMGVAVKRLLTQLRRHDREAYDALPEELRTRYQPSGYLLFGDVKKDSESRRLLLPHPDPPNSMSHLLN